MKFKKTLDNKTKAFTLAEVVVVMAILGVMMAAFAPVITKRNLAGGGIFKDLEGSAGIYYGTNGESKTVTIGDNGVNYDTMATGIRPKLLVVSKDNSTPQIILGRTQSGADPAPKYLGIIRMDNNKNIVIGGHQDSSGKLSINNNVYDTFGGSYVDGGTGNNTIIGYNTHPNTTDTDTVVVNTSTIIGSNACSQATSLHNTICIGYNSGGVSGAVSGRIFIGNSAREYQASDIFFGSRSLSDMISTTASDIRLKNVGEEFTGGIDELNQLKFYNFTYKDDEKQEPRVGVMAQDLQKVFPNAVKEKQDGFLYIRKDDMFYAALNAIKDLFAKITDNSEKIQALEESNALIEQQNKELQNLYIELSQRVEKLDKKKTKGKLTIIPDKEVEEIPETEIQAEETTGE